MSKKIFTPLFVIPEEIKNFDQFDQFSCISPLEFRYRDKILNWYLSERGFHYFKIRIELALLETLSEYGVYKKEYYDEISNLSGAWSVSVDSVYEEEKEHTKHDIKALVNMIQKTVSSEAGKMVHFLATSYDIVDNANILRYKLVLERIIIPNMVNVLSSLTSLAESLFNEVQIGRTHGQWGNPFKACFAIANYIDQFGSSLVKIIELKDNLRGKFSGAMGAYNATALFIDNPRQFERKVLKKIGLKPALVSRQIVNPQNLERIFSEIMIAAGTMANIADDMRHLQRSEINEYRERIDKNQVGSSTMAQKRNPINWENIKGMWKILLGKMMSVYVNQISEHQRDLSDSVVNRTYPEIFCYFNAMLTRLSKTIDKVEVDKINMAKNVNNAAENIVGEPLQLLLSFYGFNHAHEKVNELTSMANQQHKGLYTIAKEDPEIFTFMEKHFTEKQKAVLDNPAKNYLGASLEVSQKVISYWKEKVRVCLNLGHKPC